MKDFGEGAVRFPRPPGAVLDVLRARPGVIDVVVTEAHVLVTFDPSRGVPDLSLDVADAPVPGREVAIRVRYDGADLDAVAAAAGLSVAEVIARHAARVLEVRMVGFLPGFAYLGDVDPLLVLPRRASPRPRVPAGAVAIAGRYSGVYPFASPGGWHLLGTAVDFVGFTATKGATLRLGDRVRFEAVP